MPKLNSLTIKILKQILTEYELSTTGNKTELINRLIDETGSDEIDSYVLKSILDKPNETMTLQLTNLASIVNGISEKMNELYNEKNRTVLSLEGNESNPAVQNEDNEGERTSSNERSSPEVHVNISTREHVDSFEVQRNETMNIRDITAILPEFDPIRGNLPAEQFIAKINVLSSTYGWSHNTILLAAQGRLRGYAKTWLDAQPVFRTYESFATALINDFPYAVSNADMHRKMINRLQTRNETIVEYYYAMLTIGRHGKLDDRSINQHIINGLANNQLKQTLKTILPKTCPELLAIINENKELKNTSSFPSTSHDKSSATNERKTSERQTEQKKNENGNAVNRKPPTCYNCAKPGHLSIHCPDPQKKPRCQICKKTNHVTENCPTGRPNVNKITDETETTLIKNIRINGKLVKCFIDPGSSRSLIKSSIAYELAQTSTCKISLIGFAGGKYECVEQVQLTLELDDKTFDVIMLVVEDINLSNDVLLGRDILCRDGQKLTIENGECRIENVLNITKAEEEQQDNPELQTLLQKYHFVFANKLSDLGKCTKIQMNIELTSSTPIQLKPYRIPFARRVTVNEIVSELLENDIIRKSSSIYASPIVLVMKKTGEPRLCVDYRALNKITKKIPFPIPIIEEQLAQLAGNKYFTTLDLRMGYHQIEIAEDSKKYTAFITNDGHYEYNRMPFGLINAPGVFQSLMNQLCALMQPGEILTYLDDVIIPSPTKDVGLERLEKVLRLLHDFGLTLRKDKCQFLATEIQHLGYQISADGIIPGYRKIAAISDFKRPINQTDVRRFLGLTGFFRKFVPHYALIISPLTALLRKDCTDFKWESKQQEAFTILIDKLVNAPILKLYDVTAKHEVHTDACAIGLAGVLLQSHDDNIWHPVSYYSRCCTKTESKCHSYELEVLAIVETLERFRLYLLGKQFNIITDCAAIATMKQTKELKPKVARWWLRLMEYDCNIVHKKGSMMAHVDALSRAPVEAATEATEAGFVFKINNNIDDWLYIIQVQDDTLQTIHSVLTGQLKTSQDKQIKQDYELKNHRIYRKTERGLRFVVPKSIRWRVVEHNHDKMGHFSLNKTIERIKQKFWFPRMTKYVKEYIAACIECCFNKTRGGKIEGELHLTDVEPVPFASIHIDHLGPFIRSSRGNTHIIAISDAFTKYLVVKPVRNTKTTPVITVINELTSYFGLPSKITTDRGTAYTSKSFEDYCKQNYIRHIKSAVRTPRANGQVERANRMILDYLRTTTTHPKDWDLQLRELQWAINTQINTTTGFSPNQLLFDFSPRDIVKNALTSALEEQENKNIHPTPIRQQALENIQSARRKWKIRFDNSHKKPEQYEVDDLVVLQNEPASTGESRKLEPRFKGPYRVTKILDHDRYLIENIPGTTERKFCSVFTTDKMKKWCSTVPEMTAIEDDDISGNGRTVTPLVKKKKKNNTDDNDI